MIYISFISLKLLLQSVTETLIFEFQDKMINDYLEIGRGGEQPIKLSGGLPGFSFWYFISQVLIATQELHVDAIR